MWFFSVRDTGSVKESDGRWVITYQKHIRGNEGGCYQRYCEIQHVQCRVNVPISVADPDVALKEDLALRDDPNDLVKTETKTYVDYAAWAPIVQFTSHQIKHISGKICSFFFIFPLCLGINQSTTQHHNTMNSRKKSQRRRKKIVVLKRKKPPGM